MSTEHLSGAPSSLQVAVIVAAYNAETTLGAALASIAAQSVQPAEVVVVDDCSSDATADTAEQWRTRLPLTVVSMAQNAGPAGARHAGIAASSAPVLALLDADDYWFPDHLELCLQLRDANANADVAVGGRGVGWRPGTGTAAGFRAPFMIGPPPDGQLEWIVRDNGFSSHAVLARSAYERVGGYTTRDAGVDDGVEDWDLWIRLARAGVRLARVARATFLYRVHGTSLSSNNERMALSGLRMLDRLEHEVFSSAERDALQPALREGRARLRLSAAFACAEAGDDRRARSLAIGALRGARGTALRAAAVALAPRASAQLRTRRAGTSTTPWGWWSVDGEGS